MESHAETRRGFLASLLGAGLAGGLGPALAHAVADQPEDERSFVPLFDGKTLKGWHTNAERIFHGTGGNWQVEDGAITGEQNPPRQRRHPHDGPVVRRLRAPP